MLSADRRAFLRFLTSAVVTAALPKSIEKALAVPAHQRTGTIQDVEHVVFLMQENRVVRPLLRHAARRARLRRSASGHAAVGQAGLAPARRQRRAAAVPPGRRTISACSFSRTRRTAGPTRRRPGTAANTTSGSRTRARTTMAYFTREDIPFHYALADAFTVCDALPLLADRADRSEPLSHVDRLGRQRRHGRRPRHRQRRSRLRLVDLSGAPGARRHLVEDLPGHRPRARCGRLLGLDRRRVHRQLRRQLAAVLPPVSERAARAAPLYEKARTRYEHRGAGHAVRCLFDDLRDDVRDDRLPQVSWIVAPEAFSEHPQLARELRRLVHLAGARRADLQSGGLEQDRAVHHLRRERRLLRPPRAADAAALGGGRRCRPSTRNEIFPGNARLPARPVRPRACACR